MTPADYERRPEVKAALKLVRANQTLRRAGGWMTFKMRLRDILGIPLEQHGNWDVPTEFIYAQKRVTSGWSATDAFQQVLLNKVPVCCGLPLPPGAGKYGCPNCEGDNAK